ncbi:MAG: redox-sensing transcriptional repressor Rex [Candidatus Zixiibacteriota bacterium]
MTASFFSLLCESVHKNAGYAMPRNRRISESTIRRLSVYYRLLSGLEKEGAATVSSRELAQREKLTPAQVRKDLSFFGSFGTRGLGYPVRELREKIGRILGLNRTWNVAVVGAGNIGSALVSYKEFQKQGFLIKQIFDNDQRKIGSNHKGIVVSDVKNLREELKAGNIDILVVAVPGSAAQGVLDEAVAAGVRAVLNFAPVSIKVPEHISLRNENMSMELEQLSYFLTSST